MEKTDFVILAAGRGERLWPITNHIPKTMVRILKKPLLEWIVEGVYPFARKIVIVVGFKKETVEKHFSKTPYADKIVFMHQKEQKGTAHALLEAEKEVQGNFVVFNGDNFFDPHSFHSFLDEMREGNWFLVGKKVEDKSSYGEIVSENGMLKRIVEKQGAQEPGTANTNLAFLPKSFFSILKGLKPSERGELEFTDALNVFASENKVKIIEYPGFWEETRGWCSLCPVPAPPAFPQSASASRSPKLFPRKNSCLPPSFPPKTSSLPSFHRGTNGKNAGRRNCRR